MRRKIADQLGDVISDLGADEAGKRHALLELRSWLASAEQELALATGRVQAIADRLAALAKDQERSEMINTEMRDEDA